MKCPYEADDFGVEVVASLAEAWIEIPHCCTDPPGHRSPPSRRRGLKCPYEADDFGVEVVASLAEAWIEIGQTGYH